MKGNGYHVKTLYKNLPRHTPTGEQRNPTDSLNIAMYSYPKKEMCSMYSNGRKLIYPLKLK